MSESWYKQVVSYMKENIIMLPLISINEKGKETETIGFRIESDLVKIASSLPYYSKAVRNRRWGNSDIHRVIYRTGLFLLTEYTKDENYANPMLTHVEEEEWIISRKDRHDQALKHWKRVYDSYQSGVIEEEDFKKSTTKLIDTVDSDIKKIVTAKISSFIDDDRQPFSELLEGNIQGGSRKSKKSFLD